MFIPETTSAESFERYVGGKVLFESRGEAWRDVKAWIVALPAVVDSLHLPSVSEPYVAWTISGEVDFQERENKQSWITNRIKKGSFFLTSGGAPFESRWKAVTPEPFEAMLLFIELPLLDRALEEVFGVDADKAHLRDISAFTDDTLDSLMAALALILISLRLLGKTDPFSRNRARFRDDSRSYFLFPQPGFQQYRDRSSKSACDSGAPSEYIGPLPSSKGQLRDAEQTWKYRTGSSSHQDGLTSRKQTKVEAESDDEPLKGRISQ